MSRRQSRYGFQAPMPSGSLQTEVVFEPRGLDNSQPYTDVEPGRADLMYNLVVRDGGVVGRPNLRYYPSSSAATPLNSQILGGAEIVSVTGVPRILVSGTTQWAWFSNGSWSKLSYVTAGGISDPPSLSTVSYWDLIQIYDPASDEMLAVGAPASYQSLYCWKSGSTLFSTLTTAPRAKYVAAYDNYLVALNVRDPASANSLYVQRVQWSDRGNPSNWTGGLSGFEDLLDMRGAGTRILNDGRRLVIFSDQEIWQGVTANAPFQFVFSAVDRTVGCPYPWTIAQTPIGIMFLGNGGQIYLLPRDGGQAVPAPGSERVKRTFLDNLPDYAERAWSIYDPFTNTWRLYYSSGNNSDYPTIALWLHLDSGEWTPQRYNTYSNGPDTEFQLSRGWLARRTSTQTGTEWDDSGFSGTYTWANVPGTWNQMAASTAYGPTTVMVGQGGGSVLGAGAVLKEWSELAFQSDVDVYRPITLWRGAVPGGADGDRMKSVNEVAVTYTRVNGDTSMSVTVATDSGAANTAQSLTLGSSSGGAQHRQQTAYVYSNARNPLVQLVAAPWNSLVRRITVRYRTDGYRGYTDSGD